MISGVKGNILQADTQAVVNTVNTVGIMGKGLALQFKQAYPDNFRYYAAMCQRGELRPGVLCVYEVGGFGNPQYIINFPTKRHWRDNSRLEDIQSGLVTLIETIQNLKIVSISVPPLGCGLGKLDWNIVRPLIEQAFTSVPTVDVRLYHD